MVTSSLSYVKTFVSMGEGMLDKACAMGESLVGEERAGNGLPRHWPLPRL